MKVAADYGLAYTKAEGETYGPKRCPVVGFPRQDIGTFGYDAWGDYKVVAFRDANATHQCWFAVSKDGYSFASRRYVGTSGVGTSYGFNSNVTINSSRVDATVWQNKVKIFDSTGDGNPDTAIVSVEMYEGAHARQTWRIDLTADDPLADGSIKQLVYSDSIWSTLRNGGTIPKGNTHIYGNPEIGFDNDAMHTNTSTGLIVHACQTDQTTGAINAMSDDVNWINDGGEIMKDGSVNLNWANSGYADLSTTRSELEPIEANVSRFSLFYTSSGAVGNSTDDDVMLASADIVINASPTPPTIHYRDAISLKKQTTGIVPENLVGYKKISDSVVAILTTPIADNDHNEKLNLQICTNFNAVNTKARTQIAFTSVASDQINKLNHGYETGDEITFATDGTLPTGIDTPSQKYYAIKIDPDNIKVATTLKRAYESTAETLTGGSGNHTCDTTAPIDFTTIDLNISTYVDGVGIDSNSRYNYFGQGNVGDGDGLQQDRKIHTQIHHIAGTNTLLILHPVYLPAVQDAGQYASTLLITVPDYTNIGSDISGGEYAPVLEYVRGSVLNSGGLDLNAWQSHNTFNEPQFVESDNKVFIVHQNIVSTGSALAYGNYKAVEVELPSPVSNLATMRNLVGWGATTQNYETPYFNDSLVNMNTASGTTTNLEFIDDKQGTGTFTISETFGAFTSKTLGLGSGVRAGGDGLDNVSRLKIKVKRNVSSGKKVKLTGIFATTNYYVANSPSTKHSLNIYAKDSAETSDLVLTSNLTNLYPDAAHGGTATPSCTISDTPSVSTYDAKFPAYSATTTKCWQPFEVTATATDGEVVFFIEATPQTGGSKVNITGLCITIDNLNLGSIANISNNTVIANPDDTVLVNSWLQVARDGKSFAYSSTADYGIVELNDKICIDDLQAKS
jgi:hypothetical protein